MAKNLHVGDWVNSFEKGIFRIDRIIDRYYEESSPVLGNNQIGDKMEDRTIVSKRFLNSKYKLSLGYDDCSEHFVSPLTAGQRVELEKVLTAKPSWLKDLDDYQVPTLMSLYNSELQIDNENDRQTVLELIDFIRRGRSFAQIQNEMRRLDILRLKPRSYGNYDLQFVNFDAETVDKRLIYREARLHRK